MTALNVVYRQYCVVDLTIVEEFFFPHLNMLKMAFCNLHKISGLDQDVPPFLSTHMLDLQSIHFKMSMLHNFKVALHKNNQFNPITRLWCKISTFVVFNLNLSEYIKQTEVTNVQIIGPIENKWTFNIVAFMENKLCNRLNTHLDLCTRFHR
jgi:hypothetical protein